MKLFLYILAAVGLSGLAYWLYLRRNNSAADTQPQASAAPVETAPATTQAALVHVSTTALNNPVFAAIAAASAPKTAAQLLAAFSPLANVIINLPLTTKSIGSSQIKFTSTATKPISKLGSYTAAQVTSAIKAVDAYIKQRSKEENINQGLMTASGVWLGHPANYSGPLSFAGSCVKSGTNVVVTVIEEYNAAYAKGNVILAHTAAKGIKTVSNSFDSGIPLVM